MKKQSIDLTTAQRMQPLLSAIAGEIADREGALRALELRMEELTLRPVPDRDELRRIAAETSANHRELRHAREEIERLGCAVVGTEPVTVRIPTRRGNRIHSLLLQFKSTAA